MSRSDSTSDYDEETRMPSNGCSGHFQTRLNDVLRQRRIKSKELAQALDVHPNTIARWRNATDGCGISASSLVEISRFLKMPPADFLKITPAEWFIGSAAGPAIEDKLRRILSYMQSLDEDQLDHFLALVDRMIDFAERRPAEPEGAAK